MPEVRPPQGPTLPKVPTLTPSKPPEAKLDAIALVDDGPAGAAAPSKIRAFAVAGAHSHQTEFKRKPNADGTGICRVRTFHGRLSDEGMAYLDDKINEWLDSHTEIEVKHVTTAIGMYDGKIKEPALVVNVWY
jgi:hypothetical protein